MTRSGVRLAVCLVGCLVVCATAVTPVSAAGGQVELDAALNNQSASDTISFSFTARSNSTVTADGGLIADGGAVEFAFQEWEDTTSGADGSSRTWEVVAGHRYRVTYKAQASSGATETTHSVQAEIVGENGASVASERLSLRVEILEPSFGSVDSEEIEVVFTDDGSASTSSEITFDNVGQGVMRPSEIRFDGLPSGFDVQTESISEQVDSGETGSATINVDVDSSVEAGEYALEGTIIDSLDNRQQVRIPVVVRKPPIASIEDVDVGGVLRGRSKTVEVTISEQAGNRGINGLTAEIIGTDSEGDLTVNEAGSVSTAPGGSDTISITVGADQDADQHANLDWQIRFKPQNQYSPDTVIDVSSEVVYPPELGKVEAESKQIVFDTPRSEATSQTTETAIQFENTGDLEMTLTGIDVSVEGNAISADVSGIPSTVDGLSEGTATLRLSADPEAPEGKYPYDITVYPSDADPKTITRTFTVEHVPRLDVKQSSVAYGEVPISSSRTRTVDLSEGLEYEQVSNIRVRRVSGPNRWIQIVDQPPSLQPGETAPLVFALQFNTSADVGQTYEWVFEISGENVETKRISVTAQPIVNVDVTDSLEKHASDNGARGEVATRMLSTLQQAKQDVESESNGGFANFTRVVSAAETTVLLLNATENASQARQNNGPEAAQSYVVRSAAMLSALSTYSDTIRDPELRQQTVSAYSVGSKMVGAQIEQQETYYQNQLNDNPTTIERARITRQLARFAVIRGETSRASELESQSDTEFNNYLDQIERATDRRQAAREEYEALRENSTAIILGQPIMLNPARLDAVQVRIKRIDTHYDTSAQTFATAGASSQAQSVRDKQSDVTRTLQRTQYSLLGASALYSIIVGAIIVQSARQLYAFLRDRRLVALGSSLQ